MDGNQAPANSNQLPVTSNPSAGLRAGQTPAKTADEVIDRILGDDDRISATSHQPPATNYQSVMNMTKQDDVVAPIAQGQLGNAAVQNQEPPLPPVSTPNKEVELGQGEPFGESQGEKVPLVELREEEKIPEDVQGWVEKLQKEDVKLPEPVRDGGNVLMAEPPVVFKEDRIVLPLTSQSYSQSMKKKVTESARWLAEWCTRLIKVLGDRATFRS